MKIDTLCNLGGVDTTEHLEAVYSASSVSKKLRLDFKVILSYDNPEVESLQDI